MISSPVSLCTFTLDRRCYGIDVRLVHEVVRAPAVTPVPLVRPEVVGLINVRGDLVPTVDLGRMLGSPRRDAGLRPMSLLVEAAGGLVANLLVDAVGDVVEADGAARSAMGGLAAGEYLAGVHAIDERLVVEVDLDRVLNELAGDAA